MTEVFFYSIPNNPKNLDPSYKMDLDLWDCLGRVKLCILRKIHRTDIVTCSHSRERKTLSYSQINMKVRGVLFLQGCC